MNVNTQAILTLIITVIILDLLWIGVIAKKFYRSELGSLMRTTPSWYAVVGVYFFLVVGIYFFVLQQNPTATAKELLSLGALFGLIIYGVYEFTNYALLNDWPIKVVLVDTLWGGIIGGISAYMARLTS